MSGKQNTLQWELHEHLPARPRSEYRLQLTELSALVVERIDHYRTQVRAHFSLFSDAPVDELLRTMPLHVAWLLEEAAQQLRDYAAEQFKIRNLPAKVEGE